MPALGTAPINAHLGSGEQQWNPGDIHRDAKVTSGMVGNLQIQLHHPSIVVVTQKSVRHSVHDAVVGHH